MGGRPTTSDACRSRHRPSGCSLAASAVPTAHQKKASTAARSPSPHATVRTGDTTCIVLQWSSHAFSSPAAPSAPGTTATSLTSGSPTVMVPVLSSTMASSRAPASSAPALFTKHPRLAATPVATITAIGVASPIAQGHATIKTAMPNFMANNNRNERSPPSTQSIWSSAWYEHGSTAPLWTNAIQTKKVNTAKSRTVGTNTRATLSATRCTSALLAWASWTSCTICPKVVHDPTRVARIKQFPDTHDEPLNTESRIVLVMAVLSPVNTLSLTVTNSSDTTCASTGTVMPALSRSTSPTSTSSTATSTSSSPCTSTAVAAPALLSAATDATACTFARASRNFPISTTVMSTGHIAKKCTVATAI
mmetsp:Transcript_18976/g.45784  ORF Transcript_18976/g.45784 Transcript_18976/m.45784 type:complete len:364 (-) Transcript_18976:127-1218(-)